MNIVKHNREAWNRQVEAQNFWTVPAASRDVEHARAGNWKMVLTPTNPVPHHWSPEDLRGKDVVCLAPVSGWQGPILAAAGANVKVDHSPPSHASPSQFAGKLDEAAIEAARLRPDS